MSRLVSLLKWLIFTPAPPAPPPPDWSAFRDYSALSRAIHETGPMTGEAFLDGPFRRFLEIGSVDDGYPRARARAMEFAAAAFRGQCEAMTECGEPVAAFEARVWALAHQYFDAAPDGDYMLEVLEGRATHNYRASPTNG